MLTRKSLVDLSRWSPRFGFSSNLDAADLCVSRFSSKLYHQRTSPNRMLLDTSTTSSKEKNIYIYTSTLTEQRSPRFSWCSKKGIFTALCRCLFTADFKLKQAFQWEKKFGCDLHVELIRLPTQSDVGLCRWSAPHSTNNLASPSLILSGLNNTNITWKKNI